MVNCGHYTLSDLWLFANIFANRTTVSQFVSTRGGISRPLGHAEGMSTKPRLSPVMPSASACRTRSSSADGVNIGVCCTSEAGRGQTGSDQTRESASYQ